MIGVDVRSWIREASVAIDRAYGPQAQLTKEDSTVDAAVAELIEAADEVLYELRDKSEAKAALIAALKKARGK